MTKLIILLAFCASFAASNSHKSKHCNETLFAECSNRYIMFGDATFDFPTTEKEMKERCSDLKKLDHCTSNYASKCLKGEPQENIKALLKSLSKANRRFCDEKDQKAEMISMGSCANRHKDITIQSMEDFLRIQREVRAYPDASLRVSMSCCAFYKSKKSILEKVSSDCTEEEQASFVKVYDDLADNSLKKYCTVAENECEEMLEKVPKYDGPISDETYLLSSIKLFQSLETPSCEKD